MHWLCLNTGNLNHTAIIQKIYSYAKYPDDSSPTPQNVRVVAKYDNLD